MYDKIWLAGLGAYARYEKLGKEGRKLFDELVKDGEDVKDRATDQVDDIKTKAQSKVNDVVDKLKGLIGSEKEESVNASTLVEQIEELTKAVNALAEAEKPVRASRSKKPAAEAPAA